jgi:membrane associated rhomboid family serine protease
LIPLGDDRRSATAPIVVWLLIALNVSVFFLEWTAPDTSAFIDAFAAVPFNITNGIVLAPPSPPSALLTIVTAMFLHGGIAHIGFNLLFLFAFGPTIEWSFGHLRFALFYLLCGIAGEVAQIAVGPGSHLPAIGASGAIAGVLGAYIVTYPTSSVRTIVPIGCFPLFLRLPAVLVIGVWAALQFANGFGQLSARVANDSPGVAYFVHIGGFCFGVLTAGWFRRRRAGMRASPW